MKRSLFCIIGLIGLLGTMGCSMMEPISPDALLTHPLGTDPISPGMSKDEFRDIWGEPDLIRNLGETKDAGQTQKEEWIYYGRVRNLPVNYGYLARTIHAYFDGNNLTSIKKEE